MIHLLLTIIGAFGLLLLNTAQVARVQCDFQVNHEKLKSAELGARQEYVV